MTYLGTRPPTEDEWEKYSAHHRGRMAIKPGITGLWQVSGRSNITDFDEVVRLDRKEKCMDAERTTENALIEYSKRLGEI